MSTARIERAYELAKAQYAETGVDTEAAMATLATVPLSLHCWQGDDVAGFESPDAALSGGGIQVTGDHPGRARTPEELRADIEKALSLIPKPHRVNLHAIYGEFGGKKVNRDQIEEAHYQGWVEWARPNDLKLDFNATCFSHPKASSGFTLSDYDVGIRSFWIEHVKRCRAIAAWMGRELGSPCVHNLWVPDGAKDTPVDRWGRRRLLKASLDEIFSIEHRATQMKDALEGKVFGLGSEAFVVGSHEFYLAYAATAAKMICLDAGHFHPTESVADKISAILQFCDEVLLHVSRGVRWDSDHVVILDDQTRALMAEVVRAEALNRVHIALDFFDGSLNRVGAWVIGARAAQQALLLALLEPRQALRRAEATGDNFTRLALLEAEKMMPFGAVWDAYCVRNGAPAGSQWFSDVTEYEAHVMSRRSSGG
jgi:L-rhamnose isomerase